MENDVIDDTTQALPDYYYLWHLASMGVITPDESGKAFAETLWDKLYQAGGGDPSTVVVFDVGCSFDHPNLQSTVDAVASVDFTGSPYGSRLAKRAACATSRNFQGLDVGRLQLGSLNDEEKTMFHDIVQELQSSTGQTRLHGDVEARFASHGTAICGLIAGAPQDCNCNGKQPTRGVLPYFGVDPFSRLISVRTGFDDDPLQFLAALLYAWHQKPDVIVMPRGLPSPNAAPVPKNDFKGNLESWANREAADLHDRLERMKEKADPIDTTAPYLSATGKKLWKIVEELLVAISKHVPVVCASGNDGESQLLFPAKLANRENGIIAVGAVTGFGYRAGYSNYGEGLTLVAPSDDMRVFNRHQLRDTPRAIKRLAYLAPPDVKQYPYCSRSLISTDIGGRFGYDAGTDSDDDRDDANPTGGFYTQFGGTSGATALVGGVIALIRRAERLSKGRHATTDGPDMKRLLIDTARKDIPVDGKSVRLTNDSMNEAGEDAAPFEQFFGAGVVDAKAAVTRMLACKHAH